MIDSLLDRTIVPGYGKLGLEIRKRLPDWPDDPPRMDGQVVLVTGAASGVGCAAARGFAALGARVLAVARNEQRARNAAAVIGGDVEGIACDVGSVRAARQLAERVERLDVLLNNAGVMPDARERSAEGVELTFATHVLVPWVLTEAFQGRVDRIINVASGGAYAQSLRSGDPMGDADEYNFKTFYARSKRAELVITEQWAQRLSGTMVHSMHPGWVDTKGVQTWMPVFRSITQPIIRSPAQGADTVIWLGAAPEPLQSTGRFWMDRRPRPTHYRIGAADDPPAVREELWHLCETLAHR